MIWTLYYVIGFWISFGLVVMQSALRSEHVDSTDQTEQEQSSIFAALVVAMTWPICLPILAIVRVLNLSTKSDIKKDKNGPNGHGFPTI